jgi:hypothetical protein
MHIDHSLILHGTTEPHHSYRLVHLQNPDTPHEQQKTFDASPELNVAYMFFFQVQCRLRVL